MKKAVSLLLALLLLLSTAAGFGEERTEMYLSGSLGDLFGVLRIPEGEGPFPLVILSHGFGGSHAGSEDWAKRFAELGMASFALDFCGGGFGSRSDGTMKEMSVLTEAQDLNAVIDAFLGDARFSSISLWGQSQGGFVSSYVAAQRPQDVCCLVMEYPAFVLQDDAWARALPDGSFPETSRALGVEIGRIYSVDATSFDIYELMGRYTGPVLLLHGDRDSIVPLRYAERAEGCYENCQLVVLQGQNHGFMGKAKADAIEQEAEFLLRWSEK